MKKVFSVLTVAILAVSTVFAGFGGKANIGIGADFDNGNFGFLNQGSSVSFDVDLSTASGEKAGEGNVYASIKGSMELVFLGGNLSADHARYVIDDQFGINGGISEAMVAGENWSVSILGMPNAPDYAKSAINASFEAKTDDWGRGFYGWKANPYSYAAPYAKTNGVTVDVLGYKAGLGLLGDLSKADGEKNKVNFSAFVETPEYDFNGVTVQAGTTYAYSEFEKLEKGVPTNGAKYAPTNGMGLSAKVGYANDVISASVATDMGFNFLEGVADKDKFNADVAANFTYDFVAVDAYYATVASAKNAPSIENLLSTAVSLDLNSFDIPVELYFEASDLINAQALFGEVKVAPVDGLTVKANGGYTIESKEWSVGAETEYKNDMLKAKAGLGLKGVVDSEALLLNASASVESTAIIDGAKLKLAWSGADDLLDKNAKKSNYGKIVASCEIKF